MSDNYYKSIGDILRDSFNRDEDPFEKCGEPKTYRTMGGIMEKRKPPKINTEEKRVPVPPELIEDFTILNVLPGTSLKECKQAWKRLLKKQHPDTVQNRSGQFSAEDIVIRINNSYKRIEKWFNTGSILSQKDLNI